ncbi:3-oxoacyl-ACP reductase FabG [Streptomyces sp. OK228]|uniref:3-oxoacyl-ACP reductase FabG n=1 Tax=Streptomyces sp. OK228 TaxID=1882786 RepID=UPI000BCDFC30|nr:3-oxoacyl-ACP reductase FabG [Streptomyces sp. OK228]SOE32539.1 3-oxoacyl-[acyl-carrier protein] reductase [Streptomyces sp. OK228]
MSRSVLIIGGNRGIGHAAVRAFAQRGDSVAFTYRTGDPEPDLLFLGAMPVRCDITDPEQVESAFKEVEADQGPVEVLVANAGITRDNLLLRMSEEDFAAVLETNLTASYRLAKRATRSMLKAKRGGRIVLVSSAVALRGEVGQTNYAASKAGLIGFGRSLAREIGSRQITVNIVTPGLTDTAMAAALPEDRVKEILRDVPLGRIGNPEEIASTISFLASEEAAYITGAVVPVDGGISMGH